MAHNAGPIEANTSQLAIFGQRGGQAEDATAATGSHGAWSFG
jgi:hypothetical protein